MDKRCVVHCAYLFASRQNFFFFVCGLVSKFLYLKVIIHLEVHPV